MVRVRGEEVPDERLHRLAVPSLRDERGDRLEQTRLLEIDPADVPADDAGDLRGGLPCSDGDESGRERAVTPVVERRSFRRGVSSLRSAIAPRKRTRSSLSSSRFTVVASTWRRFVSRHASNAAQWLSKSSPPVGQASAARARTTTSRALSFDSRPLGSPEAALEGPSMSAFVTSASPDFDASVDEADLQAAQESREARRMRVWRLGMAGL